MEINYDIIIKYLVKNETSICSKKHILTYSDKFPFIFSNIFQNKFYRYGITVYDNKNINISFYSAILTLLNKNFISFSFDEELEYIFKFKNYILESAKTFTPSKYLKSYLDENKLTNKDLTNNLDIYYFQSIVEILDITILILDFENNEYNILYSDDECNPWKPLIILFNNKTFWEPILLDINSKRTFSYNENIIKKILSECDIKYYKGNMINKKYKLNNNLKEIVESLNDKIDINNKIDINEKKDITNKKNITNKKDITNKTNIDDKTNINDIKDDNNIKDDNDILNTFVKSTNNTYDTVSLNKLIKNDLIDICKSKNLKITTKMLKKELIDLIMNN